MNERERLLKVIEHEQLTSKQFAMEVGIQAGTISNIINGRNNPSLDVMQRVLNRFRTLSSDWLILGVGQMYRPNGEGIETALFDIPPTIPEDKSEAMLPISSSIVTTAINEQDVKPAQEEKTIQKIVVFYSDGTFEER